MLLPLLVLRAALRMEPKDCNGPEAAVRLAPKRSVGWGLCQAHLSENERSLPGCITRSAA